MSLHREVVFEDEICEALAARGWLYEEGDAARYDRRRALYPPDLIGWIQDTQPKAWDALTKSHGTAAEAVLLDRVRKQLDDRGTLDVLRHGVELVGLRQPLALAQFKPAMGMNPEIVSRYGANRLRVVRQLRYSLANENAFDLVLLLNGLPVATAELKTDFTQSIGDAVDQYRFDREPKPKGKPAEPLLNFPSGALVHFAISNSEVHMATKLAGAGTVFLPFNKGDHGGKGNPLNPNGHRTAYLWEEVWSRDSWLEILGRYMVAKRDAKKQITGLVFPRYHQLDATRKLVAQVLAEGAGGRFLIQHSAGSGKTNSIAWSAHFLADLHDANDEKVFASVIVVSDRNVIDTQLQEALFAFQRTVGVVATIKSEGASKSQQLANALGEGKKIIVCTIQTFPFALKAVQERASTQGKRFAVIADEAHSSQAGEAASELKKVLSAEELAEVREGGDISTEDVLSANMAARADQQGITYVAFTATPKGKTLQLFGRPPKPDEPQGPDNLPVPFHVYSMRQAIEEGFILDVLKNYTPYRVAFRLANGGQELDDEEVERDVALKGIMQWVRLHPYNISQKVQIVVEHFRENVSLLLDGRAKAMVVLGSRKEAVRWKLAIDRYIRSRGYRLGTLVAFSGEVMDPESGDEPFSEASRELNPDLRGRDIREAFAGPDYQLLLVANKFQTGFDQPLLCGMYVDRKLAGIQAVQTLSRLNRFCEGKDTTYILDFVNSSEEILAAFRTYYETAEISAVTDPNVILDLKAKLDSSGYYDAYEVDRVVRVELNPRATQAELISAIEPVADRLLKQFKAAQEQLEQAKSRGDDKAAKEQRDVIAALTLFKGDIGAYQRLYSFLSQIIDYGNTDVEARSIFFKRLMPLLEFGRERTGVDTTKLVLTHHSAKNQGQRDLLLGDNDKSKVAPPTEAGSGAVQDKAKVLLSEVIGKLNDLFEGDLTGDDKLVYVNNVIKGKLLESSELRLQAEGNSKSQFEGSPTIDHELTNAIMDALSAHHSMSKQALDSDRVRQGIKEFLLGPGRLYEALRERV